MGKIAFSYLLFLFLSLSVEVTSSRHQLNSSLHEVDVQPVEAFFRDGGSFNGLVYYGRRRFARLLFPHLLRLRRTTNAATEQLREGRVLDKVYISVNTKNATDLAYLDDVVRSNNDYFIKLPVEAHAVGQGTFGFCAALEMHLDQHKEAHTKNSLTVKLDDDIVYIHPNALLNLLHFKLAHPSAFLVSANVANHRGLTHLQLGAFRGQPAYEEQMGTLAKNNFPKNVLFREAALFQHKIFLLMAGNNSVMHTYNTFHHHDFNANNNYETTFAINVVVFNPDDIPYDYQLCVKGGDEAYLSQLLPKRFGRHCVAVGSAVVVHFSYEFQAFAHDRDSDAVLRAYEELLPPPKSAR